MKTTYLTFPRISPGMVASIIAAAMLVIGSTTLIAHADTAPVITNAIQNGSNVTLTSGAIGTAVHDTVTISSTTSSTVPTGTVDFTLFTNTTCGGTPTTQAGVALVNGVAQSATTTIPSSGLSYVVHYNGDASSTAANSACQSLTATAGGVAISTTLSTSSVLVGSTVSDSATLSNQTSGATGTVTYTVYNNNLCTTGATNAGTKTVAAGIVPNSDPILFSTAGTYYWQAVYSGDQFNASATSPCQNEILQVLATSTPVIPPPATTTPGTINGNVFNDGNGNGVKDSSGEPGLAGWTVWLHMGSSSDGYNNPIIATAVTDASGNYAFSNLSLGNYFVEEKEQSGWTQTSSDSKVVLTTSNTGAIVNFANMMRSQGGGKGYHKGSGNNATSTDSGKKDDKDKGNHQHATSTSNGGHGWGDFLNTVVKPRFSNGHDNGNHFGQFKNSGNGKNHDD